MEKNAFVRLSINDVIDRIMVNTIFFICASFIQETFPNKKEPLIKGILTLLLERFQHPFSCQRKKI